MKLFLIAHKKFSLSKWKIRPSQIPVYETTTGRGIDGLLSNDVAGPPEGNSLLITRFVVDGVKRKGHAK
jgi:hypothetical protein